MLSEEREREYLASRITRYCHEGMHRECGGGQMTNGRDCECPCHFPDAVVAEPAASQEEGP